MEKHLFPRRIVEVGLHRPPAEIFELTGAGFDIADPQRDVMKAFSPVSQKVL